MSSRTTRRSSSSRMALRLMALAAIPLLLLGTMAPVAAKSPSTGVTVHPAVKAKVTKDKASSFPILRSSQVDTTRVVPEGVAESSTTGSAPSGQSSSDPVVQGDVPDETDNHGLLSSPIENFPGIATGFTPRDPTGDVGPTQYVQMVNSSVQVFNKTGGTVAGPFPISTIWANAGDTSECSNTNDGDPIVLYDHLADRWLVSQFDATGPNFAECVAISQTPNAGGLYYAYRFPIPLAQATFPDYPHLGVWPDGYYLSTFEGTLGAYVFERSMMITGNPARTIEYPKQSALLSPAGFRSTRMLPSDLDGPAPPAGSPNFFLRTGEAVQTGAGDQLDIYEAVVNWGDPLTSSFTPVQTLATAAYNFFSCPNDANVPPAPRLCIDQPDTGLTVDALMGRPMWRLQYRNFGGHETLVVNQTVDADPGAGGNTGIRWYEIRRTPPGSGNWAINQQGTYAPQVGVPTDVTWVQRWMGSAAMDRAGNIALAYNVVNDDDANPIYPGIRYTGRVAGDPAGILPQGEETIIDGQAPSLANRWGDYTHLSVDPADDCTFWYTAEWIDTGNVRRTRIGSFNFPSCSATDLSITKTDSPDPIAAGNILTYTLNVSNAGPSAATDVVVTDVLPAGVEYLSNSDSCVEAPAGTLTCSLGNLATGATTSFTISVRVPASFPTGSSTSIINTATVTADQADSNPLNNTATATTQVLESADLRLLKECKPDQPNAQPAGTSTFCDIYVDNLGPSDARDVVITDTIISTTPFTILSIVSTTTSGAAAVCPPTPIGPTTTTTITCTDDVLPAGARDTIRVTFQADDAGDIDDTATVSSATPDPDTSNNSAVGRVSFRAAVDLAIAKTDAPDPVVAGTNLTYTLQVTNSGPSAAANVVVTDSLPALVSFVSATPSQGSCQSGVVPGDPAKPLKCNLGTLTATGPGATATITVVVKVNSDVPKDTVLVNNAEVASDGADPNNGNNVITVTTTVDTSADLAVVKTSDANVYKPSTQVKYQIAVTNNGPSKALNVVVTDNLPDLKAAIYNFDSQGCVKSAPRILVCNLGDMTIGQTKTFFVYVTIKGSKGNVSNTAIVSSPTADPVAGNNSSTRIVTIGKP
jgi:uncharacterized repeat protein (TIGR01451 family)